MLTLRLLNKFKQLCKIDTNTLSVKEIHTSSFKFREIIDRKKMLKSLPALDEGTAGEKVLDIDTHMLQKSELFPTIDTPNKLFGGIPFKNLPIFNIKVSSNNTIITLSDHKGVIKLTRSCGIEGFKHTKKGTNIAAQATAISIGTRALERGIKIVRVRVRGLGAGRMSSIKGLQMSGLNIISITDSTRVSWNPPRPRKARKL